VRRLRPVLGLCAVGLALVTSHLLAAPGPNVNVSNLADAQNEPTIAIDPTNDQILFAGSNSFREGTIRLYSSTDGGATWATGTAYPAPARLADSCAADPGAGIDRIGRQYFSFLRFRPCQTGKPRVYVVNRAGADAPWSAPVLVAPLGDARFDDKPALAVDVSPRSPYTNRVYVAWVRTSKRIVFSIRLSHSDDGGRTWSRPVTVNQTGPNRTGQEVTYPSVAVSSAGTVYVVWDDVSNVRIKIARSIDGGAHFQRERTVVPFSIVPIPHCGSGVVIRAVRATCVHANPIVAVDRSDGSHAGRVYVSYAKTGISGDAGVFVSVFDSQLRRLAIGRDPEQGVEVVPARGTLPDPERPDQFWPQSAVDPANGTLWVCFYDTWGDLTFRSAFYSCTISRDGGKSFSRRVKAASVASDETQPGADAHEYGDYEGLAVMNGVAHPIWTDSRDLGTLQEEIYTTTLSEADLRPPAPSG
jgi:hypothetical protein